MLQLWTWWALILLTDEFILLTAKTAKTELQGTARHRAATDAYHWGSMQEIQLSVCFFMPLPSMRQLVFSCHYHLCANYPWLCRLCSISCCFAGSWVSLMRLMTRNESFISVGMPAKLCYRFHEPMLIQWVGGMHSYLPTLLGRILLRYNGDEDPQLWERKTKEETGLRASGILVSWSYLKFNALPD